MLSRVAAQLYWLSRYLERAENMARILEVGQSFALLSSSQADVEQNDAVSEPLVITDTLGAFEQTKRPMRADQVDRKSTRLNSSHTDIFRMPSSA